MARAAGLEVQAEPKIVENAKVFWLMSGKWWSDQDLLRSRRRILLAP
jgi:hypothetical protein